MKPDAIVHNSPALESLKHAQLRSLCSRHSITSTGKKEVLIKRLKALRNASSSLPDTLDEVGETAPSSESGFEIIEEEDLDSQQTTSGIGEQDPRPSTSTFGVQTDEFGALSADAGTISKSSSLKSIVSKLFGGTLGSNSANSTITASTSTGSITSLANATLTGKQNSSVNPSEPDQKEAEERQAKSSAGSILDPMNGLPAGSSATKPAYRILDDSFANTTVYNPDSSFVPRRSFEDDSVALSSVPIWPPRPGVILISPLHAPGRDPAEVVSPIAKRRLDDAGETDDEDGQVPGYYPTIRMLPKSPHGLISPDASARKIAKPPSRYSVNPSRPPRFDLEAPALPSFAGVVASMQAIETDERSTEGVATEAKAAVQSESTLLSTKPPAAAFTFGSPAQKPHVFEAPTPDIKADSDAISKQLEEMQRRLAGSSTNLAGIVKASADSSRPALARGSVSENLFSTAANQKAGGVRFDESHDKHFARMDSISTHYAAKRGSVAPTSNKRVKTAEEPAPALSRSTSSPGKLGLPRLASSGSITSINQQGRLAPAIPPRPAMVPGPKAAKTASQQAQDRQRIFDFSMGPGEPNGKTIQARQHKSRIAGTPGSARKAKTVDLAKRRMPPSPIKQSNGVPAASVPAPSIPVKPRIASSSMSGMIKSGFSSLKSMASSGSLSMKAPGSLTSSASCGQLAYRSTDHALPQSTSLRHFGQYSSSSLTRPTAASLAKMANPIKRVPVPSEFGQPEASGSAKEADSLRILQTLPAAPTSNPFSDTVRSASSSLKPTGNAHSLSPPKKRISSISSAQRSSPLKSGSRDLEASIADARQLRAKRDRQRSAQSAISEGEESKISYGNAGTLAGRDSIARRPVWR